MFLKLEEYKSNKAEKLGLTKKTNVFYNTCLWYQTLKNGVNL